MSFQSELGKKIFYWALAAAGTCALTGAGWTVKTVVRHEAAFTIMLKEIVDIKVAQVDIKAAQIDIMRSQGRMEDAMIRKGWIRNRGD